MRGARLAQGDRDRLGLLAWSCTPGRDTPRKAPPHPQAGTPCKGEVFKTSQDNESFFIFFFLRIVLKELAQELPGEEKSQNILSCLSAPPTLARGTPGWAHPSTATSASHSMGSHGFVGEQGKTSPMSEPKQEQRGRRDFPSS